MLDATDPADRQHSDASSWSSYFTPGAELGRLGLVCHGAGGQRGPVRPVVDRSLDQFAAVFIDGGSGMLELDREYPIGAGTLFWLCPVNGIPTDRTPMAGRNDGCCSTVQRSRCIAEQG